jgi:hypothetical protein
MAGGFLSPVLPLGLATDGTTYGGNRTPLPGFLGRMGNESTGGGGFRAPFPFLLGLIGVGDGTVTGSGTLTAQSATMSGTASREIIDLGTNDELIADSATMEGVAIVTSSGIITGSLQAGEATMSGSATVSRQWFEQDASPSSWTKITPTSDGWTRQ